MNREYPKLLIADKHYKVYDLPLEATGMKGGEFFALRRGDLIKLPEDSEMFVLPSRSPVGYDSRARRFLKIEKDPFAKKEEPCYAVAAFLAPGYTTTCSASYAEIGSPRVLPLFSYAAVAFYKGGFYAAGVRVDSEKRQRLRGMDPALIRSNVKLFRKIFPKNRLVKHLEGCALVYGCPAAKNFFLKRYECPLPTSPGCNAFCMGCISYQPDKSCEITQPRIKFVPSAEEVAEVALFHIGKVKDPVVSFGQGCEGEPLMVSDVLEKAIRIIRRSTQKGVINLNTNASKPHAIGRLFDAGLDSIRVSMNSLQERFYNMYYKPRGYSFKDVMGSIKIAKRKKRFVSINYLVMPGFTDSKDEVRDLVKFLRKNSADMIQWRNLNYDPLVYFRKMKARVEKKDMMGIDVLIRKVRSEFPGVMHGYFNPSRRRMRRFKEKVVRPQFQER